MYIDSMENKESILNPTQSQAEKYPTSQSAQIPPTEKPLVKPLKLRKFNKSTLFMILGSFVAVVLGVITGWFLAGKGSTLPSGRGTGSTVTQQKEIDQAGVGDPSSYKSTVEGILKRGGLKGEGTHYLDRGLGESKYVYLTSSVADLDLFVDKKVVVYGDTISAKYASWLIDVGLIKVEK
jgi:hypothetical protein